MKISKKHNEHTATDSAPSVWEELSKSEKLRKDLQDLYYLKSRSHRNLKIFMRNISRSSRKPQRRLAFYYCAAAATALLAGIGAFLAYAPADTQIPVAQQEVLIPQIHHDISLTLTSGERRMLTESHVFYLESGTAYKLAYPQPVTYADQQNVSSIAPDSLWYNTLYVPSGRECEITLTDGTYIKLNSESTLKYPICFNENQAREIFIEGEAYLKVRHDESSPFTVHTPRMNVQVLGTTFCLKDYPDNLYATASLIKGSIRAEAVTGQSVILVPNEEAYADVEDKTFKKRESDTAGNIAWTQGMLYFNNRTLGEIAKDLERRYDVRINFTPSETAELSFCIKAQKFSRIEDVLELLRLTQKVDYSINGRTITISAKDM